MRPQRRPAGSTGHSRRTPAVPPPASQPPLFDLAAGLAGKRAGIAQASAAADPVWREVAYLALQALARRQSEVHVDDLYAACPWRPLRANAWGAVWQRALRQGLLEKTGRTRPTRLPEKHAHEYPLYRSRVFRCGRPAADAGGDRTRRGDRIEE